MKGGRPAVPLTLRLAFGGLVGAVCIAIVFLTLAESPVTAHNGKSRDLDSGAIKVGYFALQPTVLTLVLRPGQFSSQMIQMAFLPSFILTAEV